MRKEFIDNVIKEGIVDTKKYRYMLDTEIGCIKRIEIRLLDTPYALDEGWEIVKAL